MPQPMHAAQFSRLPDDDLGPRLHEVVAGETRRPHDSRPWVTLNMVASIDGATAVDGVSGALGGDGDHAMFGALRAMTDAVVVGASTVRAEDYSIPRLDEAMRQTRIDRGQHGDPLLTVITGSLSFDDETRFLDPAERKAGDRTPLIITTTDSPDEKRADLAGRADFELVGSEHVDLGAALEVLAGRGVNIVLLEGGPGLNGQFVAEDLVDEITTTLAPKMVAGDSKRMAHGPTPDGPRDFSLDRILRSGEELFLRYLRDRST